ncbi:MAG: UDP-N-acetylmuramoyl-tripeptide--D-alanyl-D-alanine ligase [bacterium]|nr:MAG: UDP-N-acetylmuramoyl-tripeptide--D-alanyl-D-alanine ligase [bacterium]
MSELNYKFSSADVLKITGGRLLHGSLFASFKNISTDSRTIKPEDLFIALKGEHFDGHSFIPQIYKKGANGAIVKRGFLEEEGWNGEWTIIEVDDTLRALGDIAHFWRMKHPIPVVGITGSNGKTTTKEMIGSILEITFNILKTEGNFNNLIGLPLTLLRLSKKDEIAVLEMGTNARGEIKRLSEISVPDVAVITNIGQAHLQGLLSVEEVREEKGDLFKILREDGFAVINQDDPMVLKLAAECRCRKIGFSMSEEAELMAKDVSISDSGKVRFRLAAGDKDAIIDLPVYGIFNVYNALAAAGVAKSLGVGLEIIKEGLERFKPLPGRMEIIELDGYTIINDTYNANPNSMGQALKTLTGLKRAGRTIAVLGDMLELGEFTESAHIKIGSMVSGLGIDYLFTLGKDSVNIALAASEGGMNVDNIYIEKEYQDVTAKLRAIITKGDCILVKGSRGMKMELIVKELVTRKE